jgi:hypothetical protein
MKIQIKPHSLIAAALFGFSANPALAQTVTVTCGAESTNTNAKLKFVNADAVSASSGYVAPLLYQRTANRFGTNNLYACTNLLFQALSAKTNATTAAAIGSYLICDITAVTGPAGATVAYYEQGSGWPTFTYPVNQTFGTGTNKIILSNCETGAGRADGDPFGAVKGRKFVVDKAGEYTITFKLSDTSSNHPTQPNTPIHSASDPLTIKLATTVDLGITSYAKTNDISTVVFKQGALTNLFVEAATEIPGTWTTIAGPFSSAPTLTTNKFTNVTQTAFYRLRGVTP